MFLLQVEFAESSADVTATHGSPGSQEVAPKKSEFFLVHVYTI